MDEYVERERGREGDKSTKICSDIIHILEYNVFGSIRPSTIIFSDSRKLLHKTLDCLYPCLARFSIKCCIVISFGFSQLLQCFHTQTLCSIARRALCLSIYFLSCMNSCVFGRASLCEDWPKEPANTRDSLGKDTDGAKGQQQTRKPQYRNKAVV
jgi:hypothetical protein